MFGDEIYNAVYDALAGGYSIEEILKELGAEAASAEKDYKESALEEARDDLVGGMVNYVSLLTGKPVTKEEMNVLDKMLQDMEKKPVKTRQKKRRRMTLTMK